MSGLPGRWLSRLPFVHGTRSPFGFVRVEDIPIDWVEFGCGTLRQLETTGDDKMSNHVRAIVVGLAGALLCAAPFQSARFSADLQAAGAQTQPAAPASPAASPQRALLDKYCVTCHNQKLLTAGLALDKADVTNVPAGAQVWEKVVRKLGTRAMPPLGMPRPDKPAYDGFASWLENELDRAAAAKPNPGRAGVHRLNQFEYTNAVRDLLALEIDGRSLLPSDESGYGFDNIADVLSVSPGLLERYMIAAQKIGALALGDPKHATGRRDLPDSCAAGAGRAHERRPSDRVAGRDGDPPLLPARRRVRRQASACCQSLQRRHDPRPRRFGNSWTSAWTASESSCSRSAATVLRVEGAEVRRSAEGDGNLSLYSRTADDELDVRFPAKAGTHVVGVSFAKRMSAEPSESHAHSSAGHAV